MDGVGGEETLCCPSYQAGKGLEGALQEIE